MHPIQRISVSLSADEGCEIHNALAYLAACYAPKAIDYKATAESKFIRLEEFHTTPREQLKSLSQSNYLNYLDFSYGTMQERIDKVL